MSGQCRVRGSLLGLMGKILLDFEENWEQLFFFSVFGRCHVARVVAILDCEVDQPRNSSC